MKSYYNDKKFYVEKALKVAKLYNNQDAIIVLNLIKRHCNVAPIDFIQSINSLKIRNVDIFNIEIIKIGEKE